jgi:large subunit ribosomal protein L4
MKAATYTSAGTKKAETTLPKSVFEVAVNPELLKVAYNRYLANIRTNNAKTLKRGEVAGGGRKPWRQKGTGRARFGSSRNPIWRHGGVAFGPTGEENYKVSLPKGSIRASLRQALSAQADKVSIVEGFKTTEYSTQKVVAFIDKIGAEGSILIVSAELNEKFQTSARNIAGVQQLAPKQLTARAILDADAILLDSAAVAEIESWLKPKATKTGAAK